MADEEENECEESTSSNGSVMNRSRSSKAKRRKANYHHKGKRTLIHVNDLSHRSFLSQSRVAATGYKAKIRNLLRINRELAKTLEVSSQNSAHLREEIALYKMHMNLKRQAGLKLIEASNNVKSIAGKLNSLAVLIGDAARMLDFEDDSLRDVDNRVWECEQRRLLDQHVPRMSYVEEVSTIEDSATVDAAENLINSAPDAVVPEDSHSNPIDQEVPPSVIPKPVASCSHIPKPIQKAVCSNTRKSNSSKGQQRNSSESHEGISPPQAEREDVLVGPTVTIRRSSRKRSSVTNDYDELQDVTLATADETLPKSRGSSLKRKNSVAADQLPKNSDEASGPTEPRVSNMPIVEETDDAARSVGEAVASGDKCMASKRKTYFVPPKDQEVPITSVTATSDKNSKRKTFVIKEKLSETSEDSDGQKVSNLPLEESPVPEMEGVASSSRRNTFVVPKDKPLGTRSTTLETGMTKKVSSSRCDLMPVSQESKRKTFVVSQEKSSESSCATSVGTIQDSGTSAPMLLTQDQESNYNEHAAVTLKDYNEEVNSVNLEEDAGVEPVPNGYTQNPMNQVSAFNVTILPHDDMELTEVIRPDAALFFPPQTTEGSSEISEGATDAQKLTTVEDIQQISADISAVPETDEATAVPETTMPAIIVSAPNSSDKTRETFDSSVGIVISSENAKRVSFFIRHDSPPTGETSASKGEPQETSNREENQVDNRSNTAKYPSDLDDENLIYPVKIKKKIAKRKSKISLPKSYRRKSSVSRPTKVLATVDQNEEVSDHEVSRRKSTLEVPKAALPMPEEESNADSQLQQRPRYSKKSLNKKKRSGSSNMKPRSSGEKSTKGDKGAKYQEVDDQSNSHSSESSQSMATQSMRIDDKENEPAVELDELPTRSSKPRRSNAVSYKLPSLRNKMRRDF